jgi:cell division protein FtsB
MSARLTTLLLVALLVIFQAQLWLGRGSVGHVSELQQQLTLQQQNNQIAEKENVQLATEVNDLQRGTTLLEAIARQELGMVKPNEIFVQFPK